MSTRPGPRSVRARARGRAFLHRTTACVLAVGALLASAAPADAAPLAVSHQLGPQGAATSTLLIVHDDFQVSRSLSATAAGSSSAAQFPAAARWATTGGAWDASGGSAVPASNSSALTVDAGTPAVDVTGYLSSPADVFGLVTLLGTVRWGVTAQSGPAGRLEGGIRCQVIAVLGVPTRTCVIGLYSIVGGVDTELCTAIPYPGGATSEQQVRLRTTGTTATLSVVGSASRCTATVPAALQAQTRVGIGVTSNITLNLLGSAAIVLQVTAVPAVWTLP